MRVVMVLMCSCSLVLVLVLQSQWKQYQRHIYSAKKGYLNLRIF